MASRSAASFTEFRSSRDFSLDDLAMYNMYRKKVFFWDNYDVIQSDILIGSRLSIRVDQQNVLAALIYTTIWSSPKRTRMTRVKENKNDSSKRPKTKNMSNAKSKKRPTRRRAKNSKSRLHLRGGFCSPDGVPPDGVPRFRVGANVLLFRRQPARVIDVHTVDDSMYGCIYKYRIEWNDDRGSQVGDFRAGALQRLDAVDEGYSEE